LESVFFFGDRFQSHSVV